jgi:hypothetical protein
LERLFVDSWDFGNQTSIGEAVFWVFWCWFVGCLVVEGVVLALGVWGFGLEAMTDSGQSFKQQLVTKNSKHNESQRYKGKHTFYAAHRLGSILVSRCSSLFCKDFKSLFLCRFFHGILVVWG